MHIKGPQSSYCFKTQEVSGASLAGNYGGRALRFTFTTELSGRLVLPNIQSAVVTNSPNINPINDESNYNTSDRLDSHLVHVQEFVLRFLESLRSFMTNFKKTWTEEEPAASPLTNPVQGRLSRRDDILPHKVTLPPPQTKPTPKKGLKPNEDDSPGDFFN
ncbi:hypothetical protein WDU94_010648 [Cyamophila willieti]